MPFLGKEIGLRWTIGDVSSSGFEALRMSLWGAWRIFGAEAAMMVCVNTVSCPEAQGRVGPVPPTVAWRQSEARLPAFLEKHLDEGRSEGTSWKFSPLRVFPDRYEIALDNDCILWELPPSIKAWLTRDHSETCLIAADVRPAFGQFSSCCGPDPMNSGIRGLPPGFDFGRALRAVLEKWPCLMTSELDEQGLQVAAVAQARPPRVVSLREVSICSPFPSHLPCLGSCGAHFVGLNARQLPWNYYDRPAVDCIQEHWRNHRGEVLARVARQVAPHPQIADSSSLWASPERTLPCAFPLSGIS